MISLSEILHTIAQALMIPCLIILIILMAGAVWQIGDIVVEYIAERRKHKCNVPQLLRDVHAAGADGLAELIENSGLLRRQKKALLELAESRGLPKDTLTALAERLLATGMTLPELVTLASFVQEEAGNSQDSNVAQVFRNRLAEGSPYPRLQSNTSSHIQSDADNNYLWNWVAPYYGGWDDIPENILAAYDTYSCTGLPAGPISNPGLAAIKAALEPQPDEEAKDAYFFVTDLKGNYYYAHTLAEHNANCKTAAAVNKSLKN